MSSTLYVMSRSPRSNWLGALVETLKLDIKVVDFANNSDFEKEFPLKKVPALVESDGFELTEVIAIVEYLISISDNEIISGKSIKDKAQVLRWLSFINSDLTTAWGKVIFVAKTDDEKKSAIQSVSNLLKYIDNQLSKRPFLAVDYSTVADDFLFSWYAALSSIVPITETEFPHLSKWHSVLKENDPVAKILSK
ncbi:hypothetical protein C6P40_002411 [Pichia californica]|uniref:Glutathione S-transferase n=1 Tax=Pichia californica TaxID=460514 RepID=A0A9P7BGV7_9ASCO|nr:hypothetical protein C6P42_002860 [[Candida] californica]KAG0690541.1 hypothetical protein C6P40_002411 [[Candida] californica]